VNILQRQFIERLNDYNAIYMGEPCNSRQLRATAQALHGIDRPGRRRRYLATTETPSIDGYIDWCYNEKAAKR